MTREIKHGDCFMIGDLEYKVHVTEYAYILRPNILVFLSYHYNKCNICDASCKYHKRKSICLYGFFNTSKQLLDFIIKSKKEGL